MIIIGALVRAMIRTAWRQRVRKRERAAKLHIIRAII